MSVEIYLYIFCVFYIVCPGECCKCVKHLKPKFYQHTLKRYRSSIRGTPEILSDTLDPDSLIKASVFSTIP